MRRNRRGLAMNSIAPPPPHGPTDHLDEFDGTQGRRVEAMKVQDTANERETTEKDGGRGSPRPVPQSRGGFYEDTGGEIL